MTVLTNMSTRGKLVAGFGVLILFLAFDSASNYRDISELKKAQQALLDDDLAAAFNVTNLRNELNRERVAMLTLAVADGADHAALIERMAEAQRSLAAVDAKLDANVVRDPEFGHSLARLKVALREYQAVRDQQVLPALKAGRAAVAAPAIAGELQRKFEPLRDIADQISAEQFAQAARRMRSSEALVDHSRLTMVVCNVAALLAAIGLVIWLDRRIAVPLTKATEAAGRIATGDLTVEVPPAQGSDEVGQLLAALARMVDSWRHLVAETNSGIATLSAATGEILASTMQGAVGASQTAAAVSETSTTVDEVKQTALLASEKSRVVSDASQEAARVANRGRQAIEEGMRGMESVRATMESIADTIVRLSERSQAIAEIIVSVGGLSDQSNLLAVNAAIEAAKAGEHGKGFAVVAQEVRTLAEQSREATRQVREILGEIQKSIGAAVMITEQGARTVGQGVIQTTEAGEAIRSLSESIARAAEAAAQIAASSQQQLAGMDQVAQAMDNINQVSAENAAGSRQSEQAAQNLHELGQKLRQLSERFRV
ncbi:methyl-accepting chemotaxis protein [Massilia horti]|uniref:Methyl-accepting chemotaxis protein n=1 Tax=Massilia horti TaxID=2562153 RepID=A0A4Y9T4I3_9BURK|nr:methyl-accepting chemotaxis protein [Massilia horti]TFW35345.1 methyl-accepting chemotaxis protein [Massilia horti]